MPAASADPVFQVNGVRTVLQHVFIIIRFKKCSMTLFEIMDQLITGFADICKHTDIGFCGADDETMRIAGIMFFLKCCYSKTTDHNGLGGSEMKSMFPNSSKTRFL